MTTNHTWVADVGIDITFPDDKERAEHCTEIQVADGAGGFAGVTPCYATSPEFAERIVACVNACEGVDTDTLNTWGVGGVKSATDTLGRANGHLGAALAEAREERDAMRAALEAMWGFASAMVEARDNCDGDGTMTDTEHAAWQEAAGLANHTLNSLSKQSDATVWLSLTRDQAQALATALDYDLDDLSTIGVDIEDDECYTRVKEVRALLTGFGL